MIADSDLHVPDSDYHSETERLNWDHSITPRMLHRGRRYPLSESDIALTASPITTPRVSWAEGQLHRKKGFPIIGA
jgi:hypothetical protein